MMKLIKWLLSFFKHTLEGIIKLYEKELRLHISEVLQRYWNTGNLTTVADAIVAGVVRILPKRYRQYVDMILDQLVGNSLEDVDFDGNIDDATELIISKLKGIK